VQRAGDAFLAHARFTQNENAGDGGPETLDGLPERFHCRGLADQKIFLPPAARRHRAAARAFARSTTLRNASSQRSSPSE